jgi:hypothetical protein
MDEADPGSRWGGRRGRCGKDGVARADVLQSKIRVWNQEAEDHKW